MHDSYGDLFGIKHNPFIPAIPRDALWHPPGSEAFFFRVESIVLDGGFAMISGEPGLGKSKILQLLAERLLNIGGDIVVGVIERPQSSVSDLYRELGELFHVDLSPANRYGGFKSLREKWRNYIQTTMLRPVLLIDEAQEVGHHCLTELRLLGSAKFDSECLLTTVLCGDARLPEQFRSKQLASLGSRIRTRWTLEPWDGNAMMDYVEHSLEAAGSPHLMTEGLKRCIAEQSNGNLRFLNNMGAELLYEAANRKEKQLDEGLFLELYGRKDKKKRNIKK